MMTIYQGSLDSGLTHRKCWLHPMPKAGMAHYNSNLFSLKHDIKPTIESTVAIRSKDQLTNSQHPNHFNPGFSNHVRIHAAHICEHGCHDSFTLYRGCTHSPWVTIILGSQALIDSIEYLYTLLGCALGYHYKAFEWFNLVCSAPIECNTQFFHNKTLPS
jgi:hypothetical protein